MVLRGCSTAPSRAVSSSVNGLAPGRMRATLQLAPGPSRLLSAGMSPDCTMLDLPDPLGPTTAVSPCVPDMVRISSATISSRP